MSSVRDQVEVHLVSIARAAAAKGVDGLSEIRRLHPDVPELVAILASARAEEADVEDWWQSVERTIEGTVISNALDGPGREWPEPHETLGAIPRSASPPALPGYQEEANERPDALAGRS